MRNANNFYSVQAELVHLGHEGRATEKCTKKRVLTKKTLALVICSSMMIPLSANCSVSFDRLGDVEAGSVFDVRKDIGVVVLPSGNVVTAVRTAFPDDQELNLITWKIEGGKISRLGHATAGTVSLIDAVVLPNGNVVTAVKTGNNLKLIVWSVSANGMTIKRLGEALAGTVSLIDAVVLPNGNVVTAVKTGSNLKLIVWSVSANGMTIKRLGEARAGSVSVIDAVVLPNGDVLTAVANGRSRPDPLRLIVWRISDDGKKITRLSSTQKYGTVSLIDAVVLPNGNVVTAVRTGRKLRLIAWKIEGGKISRLGHATAGSVIDIDAVVLTNGNVLTVVSNGQGAPSPLRLIAWKIEGGKISRLGHTTAGNVMRAYALVLPNGNVTVVTTQSGGPLRLIVWRPES